MRSDAGAEVSRPQQLRSVNVNDGWDRLLHKDRPRCRTSEVSESGRLHPRHAVYHPKWHQHHHIVYIKEKRQVGSCLHSSNAHKQPKGNCGRSMGQGRKRKETQRTEHPHSTLPPRFRQTQVPVSFMPCQLPYHEHSWYISALNRQVRTHQEQRFSTTEIINQRHDHTWQQPHDSTYTRRHRKNKGGFIRFTDRCRMMKHFVGERICRLD